mmetsp:Transcript_21368/g.29932  ORF Transcript_21368/g.29932 Transcript_21368/m.29932 type:complete len:312 (-) Transcript_21368:553-1488(-)|eukprot:CAMPEP_0184482118 /NCGR_PEP_ID=MMETSP0113_2-20130426/3693_1 /TAXON_ID=91329 /ORGANISM="Norrisiella sphaerica, Strain BC52" /LENGTH=311 /DNA_ID=CAMNT_0026861675 /DNA_START=664 /DNA_END=1599 /DNA_ORIENTATION=+
MNLAASVAGVPHRVTVNTAIQGELESSSSHRSHTRALDHVSSEEINEYARTMIENGRLKMVLFPGMSNDFQILLYAHCVKIMLCLVHESLWSIHGSQVFGYQVVLQQLQQRRRKHLLCADRDLGRCNPIDKKILEDFVDDMLRQPSLNSPFIPDVIERVVYLNCVIVVFNLIADLAQGVEISFLGHKMAWRFEPESFLTENKKTWDELSPDLEIPESLIMGLVDEIMDDHDINVTWIPDVIEREFYVLITRFIARVVAQILDQMTVTVMGIDAHISLIPKSSSLSTVSSAQGTQATPSTIDENAETTEKKV